MNFGIEHIGQYSRPETYVQETCYCHLGLCLSGLDYMRFSAGDHNVSFELSQLDPPYFTFHPPGVRTDFRFNRHRENWVIQCRLPEFEVEPGTLRGRLAYGKLLLAVPFARSIDMAQATVLRERFRKSGELWRNGTPADLLAAELLVLGIIGEYLAPAQRREGAPTPAERLRSRIDADSGFRKTLVELSREAGAGAEYLRRCFKDVYQLDPGEYRARRRLNRVIELLDEDLPLKEIAEAVGMRHVTHLNTFLRNRCDATPGELRKFRRSI